MATFDADTAFGVFLEDGFKRITDKRCARSGPQGMLHIVELTTRTHGWYCLRWGFVFESIPTLDWGPSTAAKRKLMLRKSNARSQLHLVYDPMDFADYQKNLVTYQWGPGYTYQDQTDSVRRYLERMKPRTDTYFNRVTAFEDVRALYDEFLQAETTRFGFWNYTQVSFSYPLVLAQLGDMDQAHDYMERFCKLHECTAEERELLFSRLNLALQP